MNWVVWCLKFLRPAQACRPQLIYSILLVWTIQHTLRYDSPPSPSQDRDKVWISLADTLTIQLILKFRGGVLKNHLPLFQDLNFNPRYRLNLSRRQFGLTKVAPLFRQLFLPYGCTLCIKCNTFLFQKLRGKTTWTLSTDFLKQRFVYLKFVTLSLK